MPNITIGNLTRKLSNPISPTLMSWNQTEVISRSYFLTYTNFPKNHACSWHGLRYSVRRTSQLRNFETCPDCHLDSNWPKCCLPWIKILLVGVKEKKRISTYRQNRLCHVVHQCKVCKGYSWMDGLCKDPRRYLSSVTIVIGRLPRQKLLLWASKYSRKWVWKWDHRGLTSRFIDLPFSSDCPHVIAWTGAWHTRYRRTRNEVKFRFYSDRASLTTTIRCIELLKVHAKSEELLNIMIDAGESAWVSGILLCLHFLT